MTSPEQSAPVAELPAAPMAAGEDTSFPRAFGGYMLLAAFAQGGMGEVFLAKSGGVAGIDRLCVLKKLRQDVTKNAEYVRRFLDELRVAAQLNHANICHIFDMGQVASEYYLAMEYVSGVNLRKLLVRAVERGVVLEEQTALYIVREALEALDYAHRHRHPITGKPLNLVHRDVSPQNVMLNYEGEIKLIDFGLAESDLKEEQTESKVVMGKVAYMAPEQARGEVVDGRTDQFAAGIIAYELLVSDRYYGDMSSYQIWQVVGRGGFTPTRWDAIAKPLQLIIGRALSAKASDRYASCGAFQDALDAYLRDLPGGRKSAQRLMKKLFESDHDAERRFLQRFSNVTVPATDELSPREGSSRPFVLDDRSRPTTMEEAAALAQAKLLQEKALAGDVNKTVSAAHGDAGAQSGAPLSSEAGEADPTEIVRTRSGVDVRSHQASRDSGDDVESSDTRAAAVAAYPNNSRRWLLLAALIGIATGVVIFFFMPTSPENVGKGAQTTSGDVDLAAKAAAKKLERARVEAERLEAERLEAQRRAAQKSNDDKHRDEVKSFAEARAADKALADKALADKALADKALADKVLADKVLADKALADKALADKAAKKSAADKALADKALADKAAKKAAADKAAAEKAAAEKAKALPKPGQPFSYETMRRAMNGCSQICAPSQLRRMKGKSGIVPMVERTGILGCAKRCQH